MTDSKTVLLNAIVAGDANLAKETADSIEDLNCSVYWSSYQRSPVEVACLTAQFGIAEYLISKGADVFFIPDKGFCLIQSAFTSKKHEVISFVTTEMKNLNEPDEDFGDTPFARVVEMNNLEAVKLLVENLNANVCKKGTDGESPLVKATKNRNLNMIKYLVEHGAEPSMPTALNCALEKGFLDIVQYFIENGANINPHHANGLAPLIKAVEGRYEDIVDLLIKQGSDLNLIDSEGNTALFKSLELNFKSITAKLIKAGASLNTYDERDGKTPLIKIIEAGDFVLCKLAVESGAKIEKVAKNGKKNALAIAAAHGDLQITIYLIKLASDSVFKNAKKELISFAASDKDFANFLDRYYRSRNYEAASQNVETISLNGAEETGQE